VADIFRRHGQAYRQAHALTPEQRRAMRDIETCRTEVLGGHLDVCDQCGHQQQSYNSCRNRHCPKCQCLRQARWVEQRMARVLPTPYFHVVFTLPHELGALGRGNPRLVYDLLFAAASRTLLELGRDPKRLGAMLGLTAVLHTWTRDLRYHPHLHCITTGGGLSPDLRRWVPGDPRYLLPVKVMARLFRGKFIDGLATAYAAGHLRLEGPCLPLTDPATFNALKDTLYRKDWVVYAKRPFAGPRQVFSYLGRYTHRVAISNQRLLSADDDQVCLVTKGEKRVSLAPQEFIRRFLMHVLPRGLVKIRHYGLLAPANTNTRRVLAGRLLSAALNRLPAPLAVLALLALVVANLARPPQEHDWIQHREQLGCLDIRTCPRCGTGRMVRCEPFAPALALHAPPPPFEDSS
jgi:hypothetical protein